MIQSLFAAAVWREIRPVNLKCSRGGRGGPLNFASTSLGVSYRSSTDHWMVVAPFLYLRRPILLHTLSLGARTPYLLTVIIVFSSYQLYIRRSLCSSLL
jgi:hypothetical protein